MNYVIYGVMMRLCYESAQPIGEGAVKVAVDGQKILLPLAKLDLPAGNEASARAWALAGFQGWPSATRPPGDRPNCEASCRRTFQDATGQPEFPVFWKLNPTAPPF